MPSLPEEKPDFERVAVIVRDAGGQIVGRTRLQKVAYLLELAGLGDGFSFEYRHYGPYSEDLAMAARMARVFGLIEEVEKPATWGGSYSIYSVPPAKGQSSNVARTSLAQQAVSADPIELELAATAAFLATRGSANPWEETAKRKPEKTGGSRLENAKKLYGKLQAIKTPKRLPNIG